MHGCRARGAKRVTSPAKKISGFSNFDKMSDVDFKLLFIKRHQ